MIFLFHYQYYPFIIVFLHLLTSVSATEFTPTYEWQKVQVSKETLPKGLEIRASLQENKNKSNDNEGGVYARIPSSWTFKAYVHRRPARPHIRAGFARVVVEKSTKLWTVALAVADRGRSEPEQMTFLLNQSLCLDTNVFGDDLVTAKRKLNILEFGTRVGSGSGSGYRVRVGVGVGVGVGVRVGFEAELQNPK